MPHALKSGQPDQINHLTKQAYSGNNQRLLAQMAKNSKFTSNEWLTFLQAKSCGRQIKAAQHGAQIYKLFINQDTDPDTKETVTQRGLKKYVVFNLDQTQPMAEYTINSNQLSSGHHQSVIALGAAK